MSALVPYYGFRAGMTGLARYRTFAPRLAKTINYAYRHRRNIHRVRTAVNLGRAMYKRRSFFKQAFRKAKRRRVDGAKTTNKQVKRYNFGTKSTNATLPRKTLANAIIRWANAPDTNDGIRQAPSMRFHVSGFKICATFRNTGGVPLHVHMAIIQPKATDATITDIKTEMLSNGNSTTDRYQNFIELATDPSWDRTQDCANLNTRKFNIFTHQRFQLNGDGGTADQREKGSSYVHFERYFPLHKKFEFENQTDTEVYKPFWLVVWYETLFPNVDVTEFLEFNVLTNTYVRNRN